ncbi:MAG: mechanosensitive ion channel [Bacteroidetes bacterium]|nr:mechanosensitive ion channel [Bacteroidota bacterium]
MMRSLFIDFAQFLLVAGVLVVLLVLRKALYVVRLGDAQRARLNRVLPVVETLAGIVFIVWSVRILLPQYDDAPFWTIVALVVILAGAGWFALRDLVAGIVLRSGGYLHVGRWMQAGSVAGFVTEIGYRTVALDADDGSRVRIPFSQLERSTLSSTDQTQTARAHTFQIELPATQSVAERTAQIRAAALTSFWSSANREPYVHFLDERAGMQQFEVVAFCLDESYATDLEQSVRRLVDTRTSGS